MSFPVIRPQNSWNIILLTKCFSLDKFSRNRSLQFPKILKLTIGWVFQKYGLAHAACPGNSLLWVKSSQDSNHFILKLMSEKVGSIERPWISMLSYSIDFKSIRIWFMIQNQKSFYVGSDYFRQWLQKWNGLSLKNPWAKFYSSSFLLVECKLFATRSNSKILSENHSKSHPLLASLYTGFSIAILFHVVECKIDRCCRIERSLNELKSS